MAAVFKIVDFPKEDFRMKYFFDLLVMRSLQSKVLDVSQFDISKSSKITALYWTW